MADTTTTSMVVGLNDTADLADVGPSIGLSGRLSNLILDVVAAVPRSREAESNSPHARAQALARSAAKTCAAISGGAAIVPGPLGMLSLVPDLLGVWKVQAQLVADIAAAYGRTATLGKEQMLYCLFRHLLSQAARDVLVRIGERVVLHRATQRVLQTIASKVGLKVTQRAAGKAVARYVPILGALGAGGYAYFDTKQVARTAIELFSNPSIVNAEPDVPTAAA